jgi:hypothetical protein
MQERFLEELNGHIRSLNVYGIDELFRALDLSAHQKAGLVLHFVACGGDCETRHESYGAWIGWNELSWHLFRFWHLQDDESLAEVTARQVPFVFLRHGEANESHSFLKEQQCVPFKDLARDRLQDLYDQLCRFCAAAFDTDASRPLELAGDRPLALIRIPPDAPTDEVTRKFKDLAEEFRRLGAPPSDRLSPEDYPPLFARVDERSVVQSLLGELTPRHLPEPLPLKRVRPPDWGLVELSNYFERPRRRAKVVLYQISANQDRDELPEISGFETIARRYKIGSSNLHAWFCRTETRKPAEERPEHKDRLGQLQMIRRLHG